MDAKFIPAICPNCGGKLEVDPSVDTTTCQYCGTEHIIKREVSGSITLEAYARCPLCRRNDRSEKVSAILKIQTGQSQAVVAQQQVYRDSSGRAQIRTVNIPVTTVQTSDLARRLAPPPRPLASAGKNTKTKLVLSLAILVLIVGLVITCVLSSSSGSSQSNSPTTVVFCGGIPFAVAIGLFVFWYTLYRKDKAKIQQQQSILDQRWKQATARWQKLYYCGRDDIIFIPGEKTSAQVSDINSYIYSTNRK